MKPLEHNGKKYTNADAWRTAKATSPAKAEKADMGHLEPQDENELNGDQIAAEHGPAQHVDIDHEEEMGVHHVHSQHPDGHEHHSDHGSKEEAHKHAGELQGIGGEEEHGELDGGAGSGVV